MLLIYINLTIQFIHNTTLKKGCFLEVKFPKKTQSVFKHSSQASFGIGQTRMGFQNEGLGRHRRPKKKNHQSSPRCRSCLRKSPTTKCILQRSWLVLNTNKSIQQKPLSKFLEGAFFWLKLQPVLFIINKLITA